jgi:choline dehydrogenase-like flavoprotein
MRESYDVIVVGAGASGCALAARLAEDPARSVLLVDAGPHFASLEDYPPELRYGAYFGAGAPGHPNNWNFTATLRPGVHQPLPRGRLFGGSTALNGMVFTRGLPEDFDEWAAAGNDAWSFEQVLPFFKRLERDGDFAGNAHGDDGPMPIRRHPPAQWAPATKAFMAACDAAGFPYDPDMNAPGSIGYGPLPMNSVGGTRFNTALAYLAPQRECSNLDIFPNANVVSLMLTGQRATGIRAEHNGGVIELHGGEIVLSAGAVKSPHLLMLSGIGPAEALRAAGIAVVLDVPHVGRNFTDHCTIHFQIRVPGLKRGKFDPTAMALSEAGLHYTATGSAEHSDMMLMATTVPLNVSLLQTSSLWQQLRMLALATRQMSWASLKQQLLGEWDLGLMVILMQGRSRGEIRLASPDPNVHPMLDFHYLDDAEDLRRMRDGFRLAARLVDSAPYRAIGARRIGLSDAVLASEDLLDAHLRAHVGTSIHMASSCRMGRSREDSVVDQHCRVHDIEGLRVVDTSIMPNVVRRCPAATAIMIGERAADFF